MASFQRPPAPRMADVARRAGVSHQTVSRVLNGHLNVRESTRARVLTAIDELSYRRNSTARALATRRTQILGVIAFDTTLYGPASTLFGIEQAAREAGYFISIVSLKTMTERTVGEALGYLAEQGVDGLVVIAPQRQAVAALRISRPPHPTEERLPDPPPPAPLPPANSSQPAPHPAQEPLAVVPSELPVVAVEGGEAPDLPVVSVDQAAGAAAVTRHLLDLDHRTVWHVAGPPDWLEAEARQRAWQDILVAAKAPVPEPLAGDWSPRSGYEAGQRLAERFRAGENVTAVFVANDQMALGVLRAFQEAGIHVPGQVSVAGFDDIPEAAYFPPPLTTVRQDFAAVGRHSIAVLLEQLTTGYATTPRVVVPAILVPRASTDRRFP